MMNVTIIMDDVENEDKDPLRSLALEVITLALKDIDDWDTRRHLPKPSFSSASQRADYKTRIRNVSSAVRFMRPMGKGQRDWTEGLFHMAGLDYEIAARYCAANYGWMEEA